jgi:uncharacterized repeat protein (TIGR02543 family)
MTDQSFTYDTAQNLTANGFTRTGYDFAGWATSAGGTAAYTNGQSVSNLTVTGGATVTLYAKWTAHAYTITYVHSSNGNTLTGVTNGSPVNPANYTIESSAITLQAPTKNGYYFGGWFTNEGLTGAASSPAIAAGSTGNKTFYAKWLPNLAGTVQVTGFIWNTMTLTADTSALTVTDGLHGVISYQWKSDDLAGAVNDNLGTGASYTLTSGETGKYIAVTVTREGYHGSVTSAARGAVIAPDKIVTSADGGNGAGTLRKAITDAVSGNTIGIALPAGTVITLDTSVSSDHKNLTIEGNGVVVSGRAIGAGATNGEYGAVTIRDRKSVV